MLDFTTRPLALASHSTCPFGNIQNSIKYKERKRFVAMLLPMPWKWDMSIFPAFFHSNLLHSQSLTSLPYSLRGPVSCRSTRCTRIKWILVYIDVVQLAPPSYGNVPRHQPMEILERWKRNLCKLTVSFMLKKRRAGRAHASDLVRSLAVLRTEQDNTASNFGLSEK